MRRGLKYLLVFLTIAIGCKEKYTIPEVSKNANVLVVDGMIANGGISVITLSRTRNVNSTEPIKYETNATVMLLPETGGAISFQNLGIGRYSANASFFNTNINYRLQITTNGKQYLSDLFPIKQTPPIDSIGYRLKSNGLQLYANTHDPLAKTRFYKWDFVETWQYSPKNHSFFEYKNGGMVFRQPGNDFFTCWQTVNSSEVAVGSSLDLSGDVIHEAPLLFIEDTSSRLMTRYSVLVKQYAITAEAYEFWQNMKKNTETLGSFFDAQPTQINGNIHCITKPDEPVIGFISGANVQEKRIFISKTDLPANFKVLFPGCMVDTTVKGQKLEFIFGSGANIPLYPLSGDTGWIFTTKECADCRTKGGKTTKPSFW